MAGVYYTHRTRRVRPGVLVSATSPWIKLQRVIWQREIRRHFCSLVPLRAEAIDLTKMDAAAETTVVERYNSYKDVSVDDVTFAVTGVDFRDQ